MTSRGENWMKTSTHSRQPSSVAKGWMPDIDATPISVISVPPTRDNRVKVPYARYTVAISLRRGACNPHVWEVAPTVSPQLYLSTFLILERVCIAESSIIIPTQMTQCHHTRPGTLYQSRCGTFRVNSLRRELA